MPLRDHFHSQSPLLNWQAIHGCWPTMMVLQLNQLLPTGYIAQPHLRLGGGIEIDVATLRDHDVDVDPSVNHSETAWAPSAPTVLLDAELLTPDEYEVHIVSEADSQLIAAIELVSPSNKDRSETRRAFVNKCANWLQTGVCVTIIDVVTNRSSNLYAELLEHLNAPRTDCASAELYGITCRSGRINNRWRLEAWEHELSVGAVLPTLPVWLNAQQVVPLELETTYEQACRGLRIP